MLCCHCTVVVISQNSIVLKPFSVLGHVLQFNIQRVPFEVDHSVETLDEATEALRRIISKSRWHTKSSVIGRP